MQALLAEIGALAEVKHYGRVVSIQGLMVEVAGPLHAMGVGSRLANDQIPVHIGPDEASASSALTSRPPVSLRER